MKKRVSFDACASQSGRAQFLEPMDYARPFFELVLLSAGHVRMELPQRFICNPNKII